MHDQAHRGASCWCKGGRVKAGWGQSVKLAHENFVIQIFPGNYSMWRCSKTEDREEIWILGPAFSSSFPHVTFSLPLSCDFAIPVRSSSLCLSLVNNPIITANFNFRVWLVALNKSKWKVHQFTSCSNYPIFFWVKQNCLYCKQNTNLFDENWQN